MYLCMKYLPYIRNILAQRQQWYSYKISIIYMKILQYLRSQLIPTDDDSTQQGRVGRTFFSVRVGSGNFNFFRSNTRKFRVFDPNIFGYPNAFGYQNLAGYWNVFRYSRLYLPCRYLPCRFLSFSLELFPYYDRDGSASENCFFLYLRCRQCCRSFHAILKCKNTLYALLMRFTTGF